MNKLRKLVKTTIAAATLMALCTIAISATVVPDQGRKGVWSWDHSVASTEIGSGVFIGVYFPEEDNCESAILAISGNSNIYDLSLTVDGQSYGSTVMKLVSGTDIVGIPLGPVILKNMKNGSRAKVTTNVGSAQISLSGSAKAFNSAYGNCIKRTMPIMASVPSKIKSQTEPLQYRFFGKREREDGSDIFAVNDVVTVTENIQVGDNLLLEELVKEMEEAGESFTSVIFVKNGGGALRTAMKMGKFIRNKGANTAIGGGGVTDDGKILYCASACVYAFAGGVQRTIYIPAKVGMHQVSLEDGSDGTMEYGQTVVAEVYEYLDLMGVDPAIVIEGSKTGPDGMWWLTGYEAKGYGLVNRIIKSHEMQAQEIPKAALRSGLHEKSSNLPSSSIGNGIVEVGSGYPARYQRVSEPSFSCGGKLQPTESIICNDPKLARADGIMGEIYQDLRTVLDKGDANALRTAQRGWLKQRNLTCPTSASNAQYAQTASCLHSATDRRISELWEILKPIRGN